MANERIHWLEAKQYLLLNHGSVHLNVYSRDGPADAATPTATWSAGAFAYLDAVGVVSSPPRLALCLKDSGYVIHDPHIVVLTKPGDTYKIFRTSADLVVYHEDMHTVKQTIPRNTIVSLEIASIRMQQGRCVGILCGAEITNSRIDPEAHHTSHLHGWSELNTLYGKILQPHLSLRGTEYLLVNVFRRNEGLVPVRESPRLTASVKWQLKPFRTVVSNKFTICERGFLWFQVAKGNQLGWIIQHSGTDFATVLSPVDLSTAVTPTTNTFTASTSPKNSRNQEVRVDSLFVRNLFSKHTLPARRHHERKQPALFDIHYRECLNCTKAVLTEDAELWLSVSDPASSRSIHMSDAWIAHHSLQTGELCVEATFPEEERVLRPYLVAGGDLSLHKDPDGPVTGHVYHNTAFYGISRRLDSGKRMWIQVVSRLDIATAPVNSCAYFNGWVEEHPAAHTIPPLQILATDSASFEGSVIRGDGLLTDSVEASSSRNRNIELTPMFSSSAATPDTTAIPTTPARDPLAQMAVSSPRKQAPHRKSAPSPAPVFMPGAPRHRKVSGTIPPQARQPLLSLPPQLQELLDQIATGCRACFDALTQYSNTLYREILALTIRRQYEGVQTAES